MNPLPSAARRQFLKQAGSAAIIAAGPFGSALAQSGDKYILFLPFDLIAEFVFELNAAVGGHFKAQGIDVQIMNARGTAITVQQLIGGRASMGEMGGLDMMKAVSSQSAPLISVATVAQAGIFDVVSLASAPVRTPQDMRGKTIGVLSIGGGTENMLDMMLAGADIPINSVERQPVGGTLGSVELLKQGKVQAFITISETVVAMKRAGEPIEAWNVEKFAPLPGQCYVVTDKFMQANPEPIVKMLRALKASHDEVNASDPNVILDRIEKHYELVGGDDRGYMVDALKMHIQLNLAQGNENLLRNVPALWERGADLYARAGFAKFDPKTLYTNRFIDEVYGL